MKILVIEDSERLRRSLVHGLGRSGFAVEAVADGDDGLAYATHGRYDAVVLDLMLPKLDGLTVLRRLRQRGKDTHVLILSARDQVAERIEGLSLGADDYLAKPFDFDELVARLRALVRRRYGAKNPVVAVGALSLDSNRRTVSHGDALLPLTRTEYAVFEYLVARRGRVVSKAELLDHLHAGADQATENAVEVVIHHLRRKVDRAGHPAVIHTRRGHGYVVD